MREFYMQKRVKPYGISTLLCMAVPIIYGQFSHGVSSIHMTFLFVYPLFLGVCAALLCMVVLQRKSVHFFATHFYHTGVVALMLSSTLKGIFEIAGTSSVYQSILTVLGILMILIGITCLFVNMYRIISHAGTH